MKKLFSLITIMVFAVVVMAQTLSNPTAATVNATITGEYYKVLTLDTLKDASIGNYIFRVKGTETLDFKIGLYSDRLSGTASGTLTAYGSLDGSNWVALGDSITVSSLAADAMDTETIDMTDYAWPYLRLKLNQTGTASFIHKPYIYAKY